MASRTKKLVAIMLAAATVTGTALSSVPLFAAADDATVDAAGATDAEGAAEGEDAADVQQNVLEDGEVVMEGAVGKVDPADWITIKDYELITEDDTYRMYYYEPRFSIILENKQTGKMIESTLSDEKDDGLSNATWNGYMKSGVVLTGIIGTIKTYQADLVNTDHTIKTTKIDNGISAEIFFKDQYNFGLTVEVTLEDGNLVVNVPEESIREEDDEAYIGTVSLFPMLGYTYLDEQDGYMLIPDGNGALINMENKEGRYSTGFSQLVYGKDYGFEDSYVENLLWDRYDIVNAANNIIAPIFGNAHLDDQEAYLAVIESGDTRAFVDVEPNGATVNYNRSFARFLLRDTFVQPLNNSGTGSVITIQKDRSKTDLRVRYLLLNGEDANYSGMANAYREYLLENGKIRKADTSYKTRVDFLGTDRESFLFSTRAVTVTTNDDIRSMYDDLQSEGVESLLTVYKGWQKGGLYNVPITKYKADSHIGGTSDLTKLIKESKEEGYDIYLYNDALKINADTNFMTNDAMKRVNKRTLSIDTHQIVYDTFYFQLPKKSESKLEKLVDSYTDDGVSTLALSGITNHLFSYSSKGEYYDRTDTAETYAQAAEAVDEKADMVMENPAEYMWKYADAFLDMSLGTSDYMYIDEEVPFLSLVLKGIVPMYSDYVNLEANKTEFFLQMVESGVYPSFYLTQENSSALIYTNSNDLFSTEYSTYRDTVISYDKELREVAEKVDGACIKKHEKLDNGLVKVTYDNGVAIYVNYTNNILTADGYGVGAMSYKVGEANE